MVFRHFRAKVPPPSAPTPTRHAGPRALRDLPDQPAGLNASSPAPATAPHEGKGVEVLSATGGEIELTPTQQRYCAIIRERGKIRVLVQDHYLSNHDFLAAVDRASRAARLRLPQPEAAAPEMIRSYYRQETDSSTAPINDNMRGRVLDVIHRAAEVRASDIDTVLEFDHADTTLLLRGFKTPPIDSFDLADTAHYFSAAFGMRTHGDTVEIPHLDQKWTITDTDLLPRGVRGVRCQTVKLANGRLLNMRLMYDRLATAGSGIAALSLPPAITSRLYTLLYETAGLFSITGPTESGKTTTQMNFLISMLEKSNGTVKVVSVADPPEGLYKGIYQASIDFDVDQRGLSTIEQLVAAFLRTSPHYINYGEVRTPRMAEWLFIALSQGKGLLATTHTHNALDTPDRYAKLGVKPEDAFNPAYHSAIMSQRLVAHICPDCRETLEAVAAREPAMSAVWHQWRAAIGNRAETLYVHGRGCPTCMPPGKIGQPGLLERTLYAELVQPNEGLFTVLRTDPIRARQRWLGDEGTPSMRLYALPDLLAGRISATVFTQFFNTPAALQWDWQRHDETRASFGDPLQGGLAA
jgi:hypothetical protein